jgi:GH24 family phage-related lysozyme (muramidase)
VQLIAQFEGFVGHAYPDPASGGEPWTIGYGFTSLDGRPVQPGDTMAARAIWPQKFPTEAPWRRISAAP